MGSANSFLSSIVEFAICFFVNCFTADENPTPSPTQLILGAATLPPTPGIVDDGSFSIRLVNVGNTTGYNDVFEAAKLRWEKIITNDLPNVPTSMFRDHGLLGPAVANIPEVDDLLIAYEVGTLPGGIIGTAGPRFVRGKSGTTALGVMRFSIDFFEKLESTDRLIIILHEMGHVLGIGLRWGNAFCDGGCRVDDSLEDSFNYTCSAALEAYQDLDLQWPFGTGDILKLANDGGSGSACLHWDDSSFRAPDFSDIMTPFFDPAREQLITTVSVATLTDIGEYVVNMDAADPLPGVFPGRTQSIHQGFPPQLVTSQVIDLENELIVPVEPIILDI